MLLWSKNYHKTYQGTIRDSAVEYYKENFLGFITIQGRVLRLSSYGMKSNLGSPKARFSQYGRPDIDWLISFK